MFTTMEYVSRTFATPNATQNAFGELGAARALALNNNKSTYDKNKNTK